MAIQHSQFLCDIKQLTKVRLSVEAFRAVCRTAQTVEDLEEALEFMYDHWNFEDGDPLYREYIPVLEKCLEQGKEVMRKQERKQKQRQDALDAIMKSGITPPPFISK